MPWAPTTPALPPGALLRCGTPAFRTTGGIRNVCFGPQYSVLFAVGPVIEEWSRAGTRRRVLGRATHFARIGDHVVLLGSRGGRVADLAGTTLQVMDRARPPLAVSDKRVATGYPSGVALWRGGEVKRVLPTRGLCSLAFSPSGRELAIGSRRLRIVDPFRGEVLRELEGHRAPVSHVVWRGEHIATGTDLRLRVFDARSGALRFAHAGPAADLALSRGGRHLAWVHGRTLSILRHDGDLVRIEVPENLHTVDVARDGVVAYGGSRGPRFCRLDGTPLPPHGHTAPVSAVVRLEDGRLVTGSTDGCMLFWDVNGSLLHDLPAHRHRVRLLRRGPDGGFYSSGGSETRHYNRDGKLLGRWDHAAVDLRWHGDRLVVHERKRVLERGLDGTPGEVLLEHSTDVMAWDPVRGLARANRVVEVGSRTFHHQFVHTLAWTRLGLVSFGTSGTTLWDTGGTGLAALLGEPPYAWQDPTGGVLGDVVEHQGSLRAVIGRKQEMVVIDAANGRQLQTRALPAPVSALQLHEDVAMTGHQDGVAYLWRLP